MRILVCDDDKKYRDAVKKYILSNLCENSEAVIETLASGRDLVSYCLKNKPDILFLDIELGDINGIMLARHLRREFPSLIIVYITNHPSYVFSCFETEPLNFLRKPLDIEEFNTTFKRIMKKYSEIHNAIPIKWHNDSINLEIKDICYIESYKRHLLYHLFNGDCYEVVGRIEDIYNVIKPNGFIRTHQGYVANMMYIKDFGDSEVHMKNGDSVLMSVRKKKNTKEAYYNYINRRV